MGKLCVLTKTNKETSNWLTGFFFLIFFVMASFCGALVPSGGVKVQMLQCALQVKQHQGDKPGFEKHRGSLNTANHPQSSTFLYNFSKCHVVCGRNLYFIYYSVGNIIKYSDLNIFWVKILDLTQKAPMI